jgi:hypothetical protein
MSPAITRRVEKRKEEEHLRRIHSRYGQRAVRLSVSDLFFVNGSSDLAAGDRAISFIRRRRTTTEQCGDKQKIAA